MTQTESMGVGGVESGAAVDVRIYQEWARDAAMEHASIASFARFTLELLAVGAPADLVVASQQAGLDEIGHAKACFRIASRFAGQQLGPGPLDVTGAVAASDLAEVVVGAVKEGCVGETISALLAEARHEGASDPEIRHVCGMIAEEEARHAELAWRFIGWAIEKGGDSIRRAAVGAFDEVLRAPRVGGPDRLRGVPVETVRSYGLLDQATTLALTERALSEMIGPLAARLGQAGTPA